MGRRQAAAEMMRDGEERGSDKKEGKLAMKTKSEVIKYGLSFPQTYQDSPFHDDNWILIRIKGTKKAFAFIYEREGNVWVNVKVSPEWRDFWRDAYDGVIPAYHQNKEHWNSIILDGSIPEKDVKRMIAESYDLVNL